MIEQSIGEFVDSAMTIFGDDVNKRMGRKDSRL